MKVKNDHRSKFSNLSNWKEEAWKKKIRASTGFEPVTSALPVRVRQYWHCRKADINRERFLPLKPLHQLNLA